MDTRKIRLFIATSLDGFIAGENDEIDWLFTDNDYGYSEFLASIDTTLMGYKTYELILTFPEFPYADKHNFVFTRDASRTDTPFVKFVSEDIITFVKELQNKPGKDIWLIGGGQINTELLNAGLIDELIISIHPVILGKGKPLFAGDPKQTNLKTVNSQQFESGLVQITLVKEKKITRV